MHPPSGVHHVAWKLEAKLEVPVADYLLSPHLSVKSGQSFAAGQLVGSHLHARGEAALSLPHPCPSALSFFLGQQDQVWMERTAKEEEEEEIWEEEEGVWVRWIFLVHLF